MLTYADAEVRSRHCRPAGPLSDVQYLEIVEALEPFLVLEDMWCEGVLLLLVDDLEIRMLTYADICWRMLGHADGC
jgi:hypothetical protein